MTMKLPFKQARNKTRSPLKERPLRNPGQSVRDARMNILFDKLLGPMTATLLFIMWAFLEWVRYYLPARFSPWIVTVFAGMALAYFLWQLHKYWPKVKQLQLAEDGEKAVGQFLDRLRESGYMVFHDVVATGFNVDHVIIGPAGVFTVETKTWKKPVSGDARITFDGEKLASNGFAPDRNPVVQAKAQARWLQDLLAESTGKSLSVWPVLLFPGWFVENSREAWGEIWVLEPKALPKFLQNKGQRLAPEDVSLASAHLRSFIRAQERMLEEKR
jgi:hypothetical protein